MQSYDNVAMNSSILDIPFYCFLIILYPSYVPEDTKKVTA